LGLLLNSVNITVKAYRT